MNYTHYTKDSSELCIKCGGHYCFEEMWPLEYCNVREDKSGNKFTEKEKYGMTVICSSCWIEFRIEKEIKTTRYIIGPLLNKNSLYLTQHQADREKYKTEHGEYPVDAYM